MLVLTRKKHERILIGDDIVITITALNADNVRLGIDAPIAVAIHREELRTHSSAPESGSDSTQGGVTGDSRSSSR